MGLGLGLLVSVSVLGAYPLELATLPAPSAFTAAPLFLDKGGQNRWLPHTALRCAPAPSEHLHSAF